MDNHPLAVVDPEKDLYMVFILNRKVHEPKKTKAKHGHLLLRQLQEKTLVLNQEAFHRSYGKTLASRLVFQSPMEGQK
jgi:hypothetical protein